MLVGVKLKKRLKAPSSSEKGLEDARGHDHHRPAHPEADQHPDQRGD
jgi:hypothetical protein